MTIYHFHARIIGRGAGRSVVAAAAWQNACRLRDERLGQFSDFGGRRKVTWCGLVLPVDAPVAYLDRETLWNAVEAAEVRKDAQLARQFDVAIPDEFDLADAVATLRRFAEQVLVQEGFATDLTLIESGEAATGKRHHGYVLTPTRPLIDGRFGRKLREWNTRKRLVEVRAAWANLLNEKLAERGIDTRVDHRSNKDRGIQVEPGEHVGIVATQIVRRRKRHLPA